MGDGHYSRKPNPNTCTKNKGTYIQTIRNQQLRQRKTTCHPTLKVVINEISTEKYNEIASIEDQNGFIKKIATHSLINK
jgi:hypothetical protein